VLKWANAIRFHGRFQEPGRAERDFERMDNLSLPAEYSLLGCSRELLIAPEGKELMEAWPMPEKQSPWTSTCSATWRDKRGPGGRAASTGSTALTNPTSCEQELG
jgi:hypothetical protein